MTSARYITRPRGRYSSDLECEVDVTTTTVIEAIDEPYNTGLLDRHGDPIWAVPGLKVFGFGR